MQTQTNWKIEQIQVYLTSDSKFESSGESSFWASDGNDSIIEVSSNAEEQELPEVTVELGVHGGVVGVKLK